MSVSEVKRKEITVQLKHFHEEVQTDITVAIKTNLHLSCPKMNFRKTLYLEFV